MRILIVDDQTAVLHSLEKGIRWAELGFDQVCTASSAKEAKLILVNSEVDVLLTDIEMPEENGLELFRWTKQRFPGIVGVFLTSHADFAYAKEALALGGFDYILQPARYEDVEKVLFSAVEKARRNEHIERLEKSGKVIRQQRDHLFAMMEAKERESLDPDYDEMYGQLCRMLEIDYVQCAFHLASVRVLEFRRPDFWTRPLLELAFRNVLEELLSDEKAQIVLAGEGAREYTVLVAAEAGALSEEKWLQVLQEFHAFTARHMDFSLAVYPVREELPEVSLARLRKLRLYADSAEGEGPGVQLEGAAMELSLDAMSERIHVAMAYIRDNVGRNTSRAEVAEMLHLNEEYFSKMFRKVAGCTFKEYQMNERIRQAKRLLKHSKMSISIIASKLGYDNFSYFSKAFKKATGQTPQEYRRDAVQE